MAKFVKGDIVVVPFPFSDLTNAKRRPAFVLSVLPGDDIILCQITSRDTKDDFVIKIKATDFKEGSLPVESNIRGSKTALKLVREWIDLHQAELEEDWELAREGKQIKKIAPLE